MSYKGDIRLGDTLYFHFTTRRFTTGAPFTLAGSPVISAYPQDSTTQLTAGITLTVDLDSVTGLNSVKVVATSGNGYATATNYSLVITTGTVDSVSVVGEVIGYFSIEARSALMPTTAARTLDVSSGGEGGLDWANIGSPTTAQNLSGTSTKALEPTTAGRTLDVTATGEAGIDWNNIGAPTTAVNLSGTTVKTATDVEADTQDIQSRLPAALVSGRMDSSVGAYQTGLTPLQPTVAGRTLDVSATGEAGVDWGNVGSPTTTNNLSGTTVKAVTDGVTVTTNNDKTGYSLSAAAIQAIWDALTAALTTVGSIGKLLVDRIDAAISSRSTFDNTTDGVFVDTAGISTASFAAGAIDSAALANSAGDDIADRILVRDLQGGSSASDRNIQNALRTLRNRMSITAGGSVNVYEEDDTTVAWSGSATRDALADPITEINPT